MSKSLRMSEKWFRRGLWLVAFVFAGFLIGLGSTIVGDLPRVEKQLQVDDFIDRAQADPLRASIKAAARAERDADEALQQAQLKLKSARADSAAARETFNNWIATRGATQQSEQDPEVISRTRVLDSLTTTERAAQAKVEAQEQAALDARQGAAREQDELRELEQAAQTQLSAEYRKVELRVFLYRLALTLPFVWGFIFFALFAFFVELVPYLPSYGGYVRYIVGIGITVLVGRYAIVALNRYLEKQKLAEAMPDMQRREELSYDVALARLSKGVCPGCERTVDLKDPSNDFCPHCGIGLHDHCGKCQTRKSAFAKFCHSCGTGAKFLPV
jgi:hypothetical protein